jgi:hypothetical protein
MTPAALIGVIGFSAIGVTLLAPIGANLAYTWRSRRQHGDIDY